MLTRKAALKMVNEFLAELIESGLPIERAILFGSFAKGSQREESDIDLALVSSRFTANFLLNHRMTSRINIRFPEIEVHHYSFEQFEKRVPLVEEIEKTGIELPIPKLEMMAV